MHFINSILVFFALLLLGPALLSSNQKQVENFVKIDYKNNDPYAETVLVRGGTFAMGMNQESLLR